MKVPPFATAVPVVGQGGPDVPALRVEVKGCTTVATITLDAEGAGVITVQREDVEVARFDLPDETSLANASLLSAARRDARLSRWNGGRG